MRRFAKVSQRLVQQTTIRSAYHTRPKFNVKFLSLLSTTVTRNNNSLRFTNRVRCYKRSIVDNPLMAASNDDNCIFCKILKSEAPYESVYEDDDVLCIKDIKPASTYHYLIIPKVHIPTAKDLKSDDEPIYDKIVDTVEVICAQQGIELSSVRTGFHWPPFTTVNHLHLHVIAPVENMGFIQRLMFKPDSFWFVSTAYVKSRFSNPSR